MSTAHLPPPALPGSAHAVRTEAELEQILGAPHPDIRDKHTTFTTPLVRRFIEHARFFTLATSDADGNCDCSPRGDIESTVRFFGDRTLVLPDRLGNRRADSYRNILANPHVGLLFVVPGIDEVVRVNGRATLSTDPELLESMAIGGRAPNLAVVVEIDEVFTHCARAILRAKLWERDLFPDADAVPSLREMHAEQHSLTVGADEPRRQEEYRSYLY
ncbi:pyridoxamine 5'-phosphate oxidase family protein [Rhodococcus sp. HNM0569]|uniref:pyridoxamine 5'-phosphate oxidase family protein n=1 Tax=Rhodococcus sp. HNM0569 TaxID=2716340 RepID=UPI003211E7E4